MSPLRRIWRRVAGPPWPNARETRELGSIMAEGLREGLQNPPQTDEEREELYNRLFVEGRRFPTLDELSYNLDEGPEVAERGESL